MPTRYETSPGPITGISKARAERVHARVRHGVHDDRVVALLLGAEAGLRDVHVEDEVFVVAVDECRAVPNRDALDFGVGPQDVALDLRRAVGDSLLVERERDDVLDPHRASSGWRLRRISQTSGVCQRRSRCRTPQIDAGIRLYYELTGPEDAPVVLQFGGGLFGRHNFGLVNDGFREKGFRLLAFDARGYGASGHPREQYTIEGWAEDGAGLLDAVGLDRVFVHGTSMGGMIAIAFTAKYSDRVIAACADVAFAKPDLYRKTLFRVWRGWPSRCRGTTSPTT